MVKSTTPYRKLSDRDFRQMLKEAQRDPSFKREMREFIKASSRVYKLH